MHPRPTRTELPKEGFSVRMSTTIPDNYDAYIDWGSVDFENVKLSDSGIWHPTVRYKKGDVSLKVPLCRPKEWSNKVLVYQWQLDSDTKICMNCLRRLLSKREGN